MAPPSMSMLLLLLLLLRAPVLTTVGAMWCVVRSEASDRALQVALDYACSAGADCAPLRSTGLCFLPNTLQAHASYAFNSYFQRKAQSPAACSFAGTATLASTDPSYGSCVYPSSPRTAGWTPVGTTSSSNALTITVEPPQASVGNLVPFYGNGNSNGLINPLDSNGSQYNTPIYSGIIYLIILIHVYIFFYLTF